MVTSVKLAAAGRFALAVLLWAAPFTMVDGFDGWLTAALIVPTLAAWMAAAPMIGQHLATTGAGVWVRSIGAHDRRRSR